MVHHQLQPLCLFLCCTAFSNIFINWMPHLFLVILYPCVIFTIFSIFWCSCDILYCYFRDHLCGQDNSAIVDNQALPQAKSPAFSLHNLLSLAQHSRVDFDPRVKDPFDMLSILHPWLYPHHLFKCYFPRIGHLFQTGSSPYNTVVDSRNHKIIKINHLT